MFLVVVCPSVWYLRHIKCTCRLSFALNISFIHNHHIQYWSKFNFSPLFCGLGYMLARLNGRNVGMNNCGHSLVHKQSIEGNAAYSRGFFEFKSNLNENNAVLAKMT